MKSIFFICAVCLHLGGSYGSDDPDGVGAFAYQDSTGNRYGGTYGIRDGQVVNQQGKFPPNFSPPTIPDLDDFFPQYFSVLQNQLEEANSFIPQPSFFRPPPFRRPFQKPYYRRTFDDSLNQNLAYDAARKAFDLTSNWAGYNPHFASSRFPLGDAIPGLGGAIPGLGGAIPGFGGAIPGFGGMPGGQGFPRSPNFPRQPSFPDFQMPNFGRSGDNSAFAGAALGNDFIHQVAQISPANPNNPNINKFSSVPGTPSGGSNSVFSRSYISSSDVNGEKKTSSGAETIVDKDGVVTKYTVKS